MKGRPSLLADAFRRKVVVAATSTGPFTARDLLHHGEGRAP
jgi:hypothetical protein